MRGIKCVKDIPQLEQLTLLSLAAIGDTAENLWNKLVTQISSLQSSLKLKKQVVSSFPSGKGSKILQL